MYPKSFIDNRIKTFLEKHFTLDSGTTSAKQKILYYSLPYTGHFSHVIKKKLNIFVSLFVKTSISLLHFHH